MNHYHCSDGDRVNQRQINSRLSKIILYRHICEGCGSSLAVDRDHSISQRRCKELHKTELIWDEENIAFSCRACHLAHEEYKSGEFQKARNWKRRLDFIRKHDEEGFQKRFFCLTAENQALYK